MIFSVDDSIEKIKAGTKTQTRRPTDRYLVGKDYAVQLGRTKPGIPEGRIRMLKKSSESWKPKDRPAISRSDARKEGGYIPAHFEQLYEKMYPGWIERYAYEFEYVPSEGRT